MERLLAHTQDPSYPVYVDSSVIMGMTGEYDESSKGFANLTYMVCRPENNFFPDLSTVCALLLAAFQLSEGLFLLE